MQKRDPLRTSFLFLLVAFLILFAAGSFVANMEKKEAEVKAETLKITGNSVIRVPDSNQPVPDPNQGTLVLWTKSRIEIFDQFKDARDYIIFFSATNLNGLRMVYNIVESRFEAGTPLLASPVIDIFDKRDHQFVYSWNKDVQSIYLDGKNVGSSKYMPISRDMVVGLSIADIESIEEVDIEGVEVAHYDRYMTEDDLKKI